MQEKLITFETAVLAKDKKIIFRDIFPFNYSCYLKNGECLNDDAFKDSEKIQSNIPTQSLLQKWLREVHNIIVNVDCVIENDWLLTIRIDPHFKTKVYKNMDFDDKYTFITYEEALEQGLQEALKLIP